MNEFTPKKIDTRDTTRKPQNLRKTKSILIGAGNTVFGADIRGMWLGAKRFADAPFRVNMLGEVEGISFTGTTLTGATINGSTITGGTIKTVDSNTRVELSSSSNALLVYQDYLGNPVQRVSLDASGIYFARFDGVASGGIFGLGTNSLYLTTGANGFQFTESSIVPSNSQDLGGSFIASDRFGTIYLLNSPDVSSDIRLKKNIKDIHYGLDSILKINPISFNRDKEKRTHLGFSAQEINKVLPEITSKGKDGFLSITPEEIIPVLVQAIKELNSKIEH